MSKEIEVRTTVEVDLSLFPAADLIEELEIRGISTDTDLADISLEDIENELSQRKYYGDFRFKCNPDGFIQALKVLDCPIEIMEQLERWSKTPVTNNARLSKWLEMVESP